MEKYDLASIAEGITAPFRPVRAASVGRIDVSVVICGGRKSWHRSPPRDELAVILDGVVLIEGSTDRHIVGEGNLARLPARAGLAFESGMRSKMLLYQIHEASPDRNGFEPSEEVLTGPAPVVLEHFARDVLGQGPFVWRETGSIGSYATHASRIEGHSAPYEVPEGGLGVLVYRGIVDVTPETSSDDDAEGTDRSVVGSEWLLLEPGERVTLTSRRGATVIALARSGEALPGLAAKEPDEGAASSNTDGEA